MREEFNCKGKHLALYLMKHGSKLIRIERVDGFIVYVFDNDESIKSNIENGNLIKEDVCFN